MRQIRPLFLAPVLIALAACSPSDPVTDADPPFDPAARSEAETPAPPMADGYVHITGQVTGLEAGGEHGFHVHEFGDCSAADGTSAGGHFNPDASDHGRAGQGEHHVGDSDNLMANDEGVAEVDRQLHGATIGDGAATDIVGKGVIVHAGADDYVSQPTGDAGDRLACGVIEIQ